MLRYVRKLLPALLVALTPLLLNAQQVYVPLMPDDDGNKVTFTKQSFEALVQKNKSKSAGKLQSLTRLAVVSNSMSNEEAVSMAVDYLLCFHLLSKDIDSFVADFEHYYKSNAGIVLPRVYQEGLLIKIASGEKSPSDYSRFRFTPEIVSQMTGYTSMFDENKHNITKQ